MIKKYDKHYEQVKMQSQRQKQLKRTKRSTERLDVAIVLNNRKKILDNKKEEKEKVINARKLKIKANQIIQHYFNNLKLLSSNRIHRGNNSQDFSIKSLNTERSFYDHNIQFQSINKSSKSIGRNKNELFKSRTATNLSNISLRKYSSLISSKQRQSQKNLYDQKFRKIQETTSSLFNHLRDSQLYQIEQDDKYYLIHIEIIQLFHKFMLKKRASKKDYSLQKFILNNNASKKTQQPYPKEDTQLLKSYILQKLGLSQKNGSEPLLTNLIMNDRKDKSKSLSNILQRKTIDFQKFKKRQEQNRVKIYEQESRDLLNLKLDIYYETGVADQNRAVLTENKIKKIITINQNLTERSITYRHKVKETRDYYGKASQLSEILRMKFLQKRKQIEKQRQRRQKEAQEQ